MNKITGATFFASLLAGCSSGSVPHQTIDVDGAVVEASFKNTQAAKDDPHDSLVFGTLRIVGERRIKSANLDCVALRLGNRLSEEIAVDSIASILTDPFPARDGRILVDVYWVFPEVKLDAQDLTNARIEKLAKLDRCITYE